MFIDSDCAGWQPAECSRRGSDLFARRDPGGTVVGVVGVTGANSK